MTTILQDATEIKARCDGLSVAAAYAAPLPPPAKRYVGCWAEEGKSEWGGSVPAPTPPKRRLSKPARSSWEVKEARRPCMVWACPVEEEV